MFVCNESFWNDFNTSLWKEYGRKNRNMEQLEQLYTKEVIEEEDKYIIEYEMPGFKPEEIEVTVTSGYVYVKGKNDKREFERRIKLPKLDSETAVAELNLGILTIIVYKSDKKEMKKITVTETSSQK